MAIALNDSQAKIRSMANAGGSKALLMEWTPPTSSGIEVPQ